MKELTDQIFPVKDYTNKIHTAVKAVVSRQPNLSFTVSQIRPGVIRGYPWLNEVKLTERQLILLDQIIKTGLTKLIQLGLVKKVSSKVQVESQWQWASAVADSGYTNVTSEDSVAQTEEAKKGVSRRALGGKSLWKLNGEALVNLFM